MVSGPTKKSASSREDNGPRLVGCRLQGGAQALAVPALVSTALHDPVHVGHFETSRGQTVLVAPIFKSKTDHTNPNPCSHNLYRLADGDFECSLAEQLIRSESVMWDF